MENQTTKKCRKGIYTTSSIVILSAPLVCYGGFGQPKCEYLEDCIADWIGNPEDLKDEV